MNFECLRILAACDTGATEAALLAQGITKEMLVVLHEDGWIDALVERKANPPGLVLNRYHITAQGRMVLETRT